MKAVIDMKKDVVAVTLYSMTDIAAIGFWDSGKMGWVSSNEVYFDKFNNVFEEDVPETAAGLVITDTNGDGNYKLQLKFNQGLDDLQAQLVYKQELTIQFETSGKVIVGSPENIGYKQERAETNNVVDSFDITPGKYIVDAYSLLINDEQGNPKFIEYVFCIWDEAKYKGDSSVVKTISRALSLKYREPTQG